MWTEAEHSAFVEDVGCGTLLEWQVGDSTKSSGALSNQSETGPAAVVDSETEVRNCWDNCQNLDVETQGSSCRSIARMGTWPHRCRRQVKSSTNMIHPVLHARIRDQAQRPSVVKSRPCGQLTWSMN